MFPKKKTRLHGTYTFVCMHKSDGDEQRAIKGGVFDKSER